jgi:sarcosine oxidase
VSDTPEGHTRSRSEATDENPQGPEPEAAENPSHATESSGGIDRRSFLRTTGLGAGALAMAGSMGGVLAGCREGAGPLRLGTGPEVVVIGAGAFGTWTAYHLQLMGARVTLVDLYGPGNSRSTSGDETRGIRSSYAGRELWTSWAAQAMDRWRAFDEEYAPAMGAPVYFTTGDLILRESEEQLQGVRDTWDQTGVTYEVLSHDEIAYRWPQIRIDGIEAALYEPGAGVARSRAACQRLAHIVQQRGGAVEIGRATLGSASGRRLDEVVLDDGDRTLAGDRYVFALGPWFPTAFPEIMAERIRIPMGHVFYWGVPPGDHRYSYPHLPSWGFPGVTGWPTLPPDHRGFRLRTGGRPGEDPDTSDRWIPEEYMDRPRQVLEERFPELLEQPLVETRACHYESSSTREWIIDRHPDLDNVWFAGGGSAEGFKFGPMIGELIASRVLEDDRFAELDGDFRLEDVDEVAE